MSWGLVACLLAVPAAAQERVAVRVLADTVQEVGADGAARPLWAFSNPTTELVQGEGLEAGSGGSVELRLSAGGSVTVRGPGRLHIERLAAAGDVLVFPSLTRIDVRAGDRPLTLVLPGGLRCKDLEHASLIVVVDETGMVLRNQGSTRVALRGPAGAKEPGGSLELGRGQGIRIPLFLVQTSRIGGIREPWGPRIVDHDEDMTMVTKGRVLRLHCTSGREPGAVRIDGVLGHVAPGATWIMHDMRWRSPSEPAPGATP